MGIEPLLKTVLYLYVAELYGTEGLQTDLFTRISARNGIRYAIPLFRIDKNTARISRLPALRKRSDTLKDIYPAYFQLSKYTISAICSILSEQNTPKDL